MLRAFKTPPELNLGADDAHPSSLAYSEAYEVFHGRLQQTTLASVQETAPRLLDRMAVAPMLLGGPMLPTQMHVLPSCP